MRCLLALDSSADRKLAEFVEDKTIDHELLEKNAHLLKEVPDKAGAKKKPKKAQLKKPTVEIFYKPKEEKSQRKMSQNVTKNRVIRSNSLKQTETKKQNRTVPQGYQSHSLQRIKHVTPQPDKPKASNKLKFAPMIT